MKKLSLLLITVSLITLLAGSSVYAQNEISDFNYQYQKYDELNSVYKNKRDSFLKFKTLTSQTEAVEATANILGQRAATMRAYLLALKYRLRHTDGVDPNIKAELSSKLDDEIGWLQNHLDTLDGMSHPALSDLFEISSRMERRQNIYLPLAHKTLSYIMLGQVFSVYQKMTALNTEISSHIDKVDHNQQLRNWFVEAEKQVFLGNDAINSAQKFIQEFPTKDTNEKHIARQYAKVRDQLEIAQQALKQGLEYQQEIIKKLNNQ